MRLCPLLGLIVLHLLTGHAPAATIHSDFSATPDPLVDWRHEGDQGSEQWFVSDERLRAPGLEPGDDKRQDRWIFTPNIVFTDVEGVKIRFDVHINFGGANPNDASDTIEVSLWNTDADIKTTVIRNYFAPEIGPTVDETIEEPVDSSFLEPDTNYRVRFRAFDFDEDPSLTDIWFDNLALSNDELQAGDANQDLEFKFDDILHVLAANKFETELSATWAEGDWNGAPGGIPGSPPPGNLRFDFEDVSAALSHGLYATGPYAAAGISDATPLSGNEGLVQIPEPPNRLLLTLGMIGVLRYRWGGRS